MNKYIFLVIGLLSLAACGGGSGSGTTGSQNAVSASDNVLDTNTAGIENDNTIPEPASDEIKATQDLVVDSGFVLAASFEILLDVDISARVDDDRYLVVCSNFEEDATGYTVDYSDCSVRSTLENGKYNADLRLPNHVNELVGVVWSYDESSQPEYILWQRDVNGDAFVIR